MALPNSMSDFNDLANVAGHDAVRIHIDEAVKASNDEAAISCVTNHPANRFRLLTPDQLSKIPPLQWRIRGVLPRTGIAALFGPSGSGKSFLALDMLGALARGQEWFGCRVESCAVIYIALEGESGISQRIMANQTRYGKLPDSFRFILQSIDIRNAKERNELIAAARALGYRDGVMVIDTLNRAAPGADENDSAAMGAIIAATKSIQAGLGGLVLLVHHTGKDQTKGLRGHSSLHAALDTAILVSRHDNRREWRTAKSKDGSDEKAYPFRLESVVLGEDEYGDEITSCAIVKVDQSENGVMKSKPIKGVNQRIVWDALGPLFRAAGVAAPEGAPKELPPGRPCLSVEDAINNIKGRITADEDQKRYRTKVAIDGLVSNGHLCLMNGYLWCE